MAPIPSETAVPRSRRQAFIATCSPDELLGQVIQALCPKYHIDAPHLFALRSVVSSAIVAPRKPPQLKRSRPDRRIGEIGSIYDTPPHSIYGINGPPKSTDQSFYFHHQDPDFEKLLPQVDRSRYVWPDEPVSQKDSDDREIPDSQESMQSKDSAASSSAAKYSVRLQTEASSATRPTGCKKSSTVSSQQLEVTRQTPISNQVPNSVPNKELHLVSNGSQHDSQQDPTPVPRSPIAAPIPTITITSPDSKRAGHLNTFRDPKTPISLLHAVDPAIELLRTPDTETAHRPFVVSVPYIPITSESQSTFASTQNSEIFSQPDAFVNFTPPTQEDSQDIVMSQVELGEGTISTTTDETNVKKVKTEQRSTRAPDAPLLLRVSPPTTSLDRRIRKAPVDDDSQTSSRKRTRST